MLLCYALMLCCHSGFICTHVAATANSFDERALLHRKLFLTFSLQAFSSNLI